MAAAGMREKAAAENDGGRLELPPLAGNARYYVLEAVNALASAYYLNYLYFYFRDHFGFGNRDNLLVTVLHGFLYMITAWHAGRFAQRFGATFTLRLGFSGMGLGMLLSGLVAAFLGYSSCALAGHFVAILLWTVSMCLTWPTLQALVSHQESPKAMSRAAGIYNIVWAGVNAVAYLTGGALVEKFGGEVLFWVGAALHAGQVVYLAVAKEPSPVAAPAASGRTADATEEFPPLNPRPIAKARTFLHLAWLANPFAYIAINGLIPAIPNLSARLGLSHAEAGLVFSVWFWVRLAAFVWFWLWPGWHYRFGWLLGAFIGLAGSFTVILLSFHVWVLILAQVVFGLSVGLIYYSSLFYSMDAGESKGKRGGIHEAAIGAGVCVGPAVGVAAIQCFPALPNAGTWAVSSALVLGLVPLLLIKRRGGG
jgi:MFS family permease